MEGQGVQGQFAESLTLSDIENGLSFDEPDFKLKATGKFDGKPGKVEGPTIPTRAPHSRFDEDDGSRSFKMTRTQAGSRWTCLPGRCRRTERLDRCEPNGGNYGSAHYGGV
jgi:hypothetical protein